MACIFTVACSPPPAQPPPPDAMPPDAAPGCPPGDAGCPCDDGACADGWVCDAETDICRAPLPCACVRFQQCAEGPGRDAECLTACDPGLDWDPAAERCVADVCHPDAPGSIAGRCAADHRVCEPPGRCGDCLPGFAPGPDGCAPIADCAALDCEAANRGCAEDDGWPRCTGCLAGWVDFGGACVPDACDLNVPGSTAADCAARHRLCVDEAGGATCGACVAGRREVDDGDGVRCAPLRTCAELGCADDGQLCTPADPAARTDAACGACLPGWADTDDGCAPMPVVCDDRDAAEPEAPSLRERCAAIGRGCVDGQCGDCLEGWRATDDGGGCAPVPTCDDCRAENRVCLQGRDGARCGDCADGHRVDPETGACVADCPDAGQVRHPITGACATACDPDGGCADGGACRPVGEDGVHICGPDCGDGLFNGIGCVPCPPCDRAELGEAGPAPDVTLDGRCICETLPGYYYTLAGEIGPRPCDVDGDGWLARGAQVALESVDPVVRDRARCPSTTIELVELVAWTGERTTVHLDRPVVLYESERNDDPRRLRRALEADGIPPTLLDRYDAADLNALTRLCHTARADYDDDGVPDVDAVSGVAPPNAPATLRALARFAHFAELHEMTFGITDVGGRGATSLVIAEKRRADIGFAVQFPEMQPDAEDRWQTCAARGDTRHDPRRPQPGFDFADVPVSADFPGMTHHSLFRCLTVRNAADAGALHQVEPLTAGDDYALTRHGPDGFEPVIQRPGAGDALWGVARYQHDLPGLQLARNYRFGCVDECAEHRAHPDAPPASLGGRRCAAPPGEVYLSCRDLPDRFGQVQCEGVPCNGIDDDDDGDADEFGGLPDSLNGVDAFEGVPDLPVHPCLAGELGACAVGSYVCGGENRDTPVCESPAREREIPCNDIDEDCDGILDEDPLGEVWNGGDIYNGQLVDDYAPGQVPQLGDRCALGQGVCRTEGRLLCTPSGRGPIPVCRADVYDEGDAGCRFNLNRPEVANTCLLPLNVEPGSREDICDGLDNDCDGLTDERLSAPEEACTGRRCAVPGASGACAMGVLDCVDGQDVCQPVYGHADDREDVPALEEVCNGIDDDCDGAIDEDRVCRGRVRLIGLIEPERRGQADAEFEGNGPHVSIDIDVRAAARRVEMEVTVEMDETGEGGTFGSGSAVYAWSMPDNGFAHDLALAPGMMNRIEIAYTDDDHNARDNLYPESWRDQEQVQGPPESAVNPDDEAPLDVDCDGDTDGDDLGNGSECDVRLYIAYDRVPATPTPATDTCGNGVCDPGEVCDPGHICGSVLCNATCTQRLGLGVEIPPGAEDVWCVGLPPDAR